MFFPIHANPRAEFVIFTYSQSKPDKENVLHEVRKKNIFFLFAMISIKALLFFSRSRRSLSPIAIRASPLGPVKRKCDLEDRGDSAWGPSKKYQHFSPAANISCIGGPLLVTQISSR